MGNWKHKINIKKYLTDEDDRESVEKACVGVIKEMNRIKRSFKDDLVYDLLIYDFEDLLKDKETDVDDFNEVLNNLYDWADRRRVWLGL